MAFISSLAVNLKLDTAEFTKNLGLATNQLDKFAGKVQTAGMVGAAAFTAMTYKALAFADQISDVAKANEVATETILALSEGLAQNGGEASNAGKMLSSFTAKIDDAAQGGKEAQEAFARVGVSLKDLASKDVTQLFDQTLNSLAEMSDPISRNAAAMNLFGKAAKGVDFKGLAEGTAEAREEFKKYAQAVNYAAELHDKLDAKSTKTNLIFTNALVPTLNILYDELNKSGGAFQTLANVAGDSLAGMILMVKKFVNQLQNIPDAITLIQLRWKNLTDNKAFVESTKDLNQKVEQREKEYIDLFKRLKEARSGVVKPSDVFEGGRKVTPYVDKGEASKLQKEKEAAEIAARTSIQYEKHAQFTLDQLKRKADLINLTEKQRQVEEAVLAIRDDSRKKIEEIENKKEEAAIRGQTLVVAAYDKEIQKITEKSKYYEDATRREMLLQQEAQNSFEFGWNRAFRQFQENAQNYAQLGTQYFDSMANAMTRGIDQFVATGKLSFADFTKSVMQDLLRISLRMQAMRLMSTAFQFFGSFGASNALTSGMTGSAAAGTYNLGTVSNYPSLRGFADGGEPPTNVPSLVGERGPELFVPRSAGTVIPNNQLSTMLNGGPQVVYNGPYINNLSAIDTQSATQFLSKNKMAVWSANQSAGRSVPASR